MMKVEKLFSGVLAVLAVLLLTGCGEVDNPRRTSLEVDTSTLTLSLGETAIRKATTKAEDYKITYTSSSPAVAMVDKSGKVTAMSEGTATITVEMAESKTSWYAAKTLTYNVVVKNTSASSAGTPGASGGKTVDLSTLTGDYVAQNGDVLKGTLAKNVKISIADCATVTLDGVTINGTHDLNYKWAGINCQGFATIILKDGTTNTVKGFHDYYPGIYTPSDKTLTIKGEAAGTGSLTASSNGFGAGIGGGYKIDCGSIVVMSGNVTATGGQFAAGIGSGNGGGGGSIIIAGGTVTAAGGLDAAGIGSGSTSTSNCEYIIIYGGTVTATGGQYGAGIGSGQYAKCEDIMIDNTVTKLTATKGDDAPNCIGAGESGTCESVEIDDEEYWDGSAYQKDGKLFLTLKTLVYPTPSVSLSAVTSKDYLGWRVCSDDTKAYAPGPLPTDVTAVAMIAYVGNNTDDNNKTHGLAIALNDEPNQMNANTASSGARAHTPAPPYDTSWQLPNHRQYKTMFDANGGFEGLNTALNAAGGEYSKLKVGSSYWTNTLAGGGKSKCMRDGNLYEAASSESYYVRVCLAF